jgi:hypothetical protein
VYHRLRELAVRITAGAAPSTKPGGLGAATSGEAGATQPSERWTCTYQSENGVHASGEFSSAPQALDFAEQHARLNGVLRGEWTRQGDTWLLNTPLGDYLVRKQSEQPAP